jgi:hypothetical protein
MKPERFLNISTGLLIFGLGLGFVGAVAHPALDPPQSESAQSTPADPAGAGHEPHPGTGKVSQNRKPADEKPENGRSAQKGGPPQSRRVNSSPQHPGAPAAGIQPTKAPPEVHVYHPPVKKAASPGTSGLTPKRIERERSQPVGRPVIRPATAPLLPLAPSRAVTPARIGGPAASNAKNTGVIDGTGMKHKP